MLLHTTVTWTQRVSTVKTAKHYAQEGITEIKKKNSTAGLNNKRARIECWTVEMIKTLSSTTSTR